MPWWIDGGWGVDALLRRETRPHRDLDLVVPRASLDAAVAALAPLGLTPVESDPGLPARLVLHADDDRQVDLHPIVLDAEGNGRQEIAPGKWGLYPSKGLCGVGAIGGRPVRCLTPELQLRHHTGYEPTEVDRGDVRLLAETFDVPLPEAYRER